MSIRVVLYEDNTALRESLCILISGLHQFALVGAFGDCLNIENEVRRLEPDVILMDIDMPGRSGIEGAYLAKQANPATEVLMLTVFDDNDKVFQAVCAGASGYLLKKTPPSKIIEAIEDIYNGGAPMTPSIARKVLELFPRQPSVNTELDKLTPREQGVLHSLAAGNSYKMVADDLGIVHADGARPFVVKIARRTQFGIRGDLPRVESRPHRPLKRFVAGELVVSVFDRADVALGRGEHLHAHAVIDDGQTVDLEGGDGGPGEAVVDGCFFLIEAAVEGVAVHEDDDIGLCGDRHREEDGEKE